MEEKSIREWLKIIIGAMRENNELDKDIVSMICLAINRSTDDEELENELWYLYQELEY